MERNGDSSRQAEMELVRRELVYSCHRAGRILRNNCGFEVLLKAVDTSSKTTWKFYWRGRIQKKKMGCPWSDEWVIAVHGMKT